MRKFLNKLKSMLSSSSRLYPYLPLARELLTHKIQRLIGDQSTDADKIMQNLEVGSKLNSDSRGYLKNRLCMNPCNSLLMLWYALVFVGIIYWYIQTTIMVIYGQQAWQSEMQSFAMLVVDVVGIIIFILDIVMQFNVGYVSRGAVIVERERVVGRYLHYYFYCDVVITVLLFVALVTQNYYINYAKLVVVFKFVRMLQMDQLVMRKLSMSTRLAARTIYVVGKQFVTIFILSHTVGIFFYLIDYTLVNQPLCQENNSLCWLYSSTAYSPILQYDWEIQYFYTFYWGANTITNISYGDIAAANSIEVVYSLFCMCFGFIVYPYITNNVIKAIIFVTDLRDEYRATLIEFDIFMNNLGLTTKAQLDTIDFLKERHWEENSRDMNMQESMTNKLPRQLKSELIQNAYQKVCNGLQYFFGESEKITLLLQNLKQKKYSNNDLILNQGAPLDFLHYLHKGRVKIFCNYSKNQIYLSQINLPDQFVAGYEFFVKERSQIKVLSRGNSVIYLIPQKSFERQVQKDIELKQSLHLLWYDLKIRKNLNRIFYKCLRCGKSHNWQECDLFFPNFKYVSLEKIKENKRIGERMDRSFHHTWRDRAKMKELTNILHRNKDNVLIRLQKRLKVLQKLAKEKKEVLQIDSVYEWSAYLQEENLKNLQNQWNSRRRASRLSFNQTK